MTGRYAARALGSESSPCWLAAPLPARAADWVVSLNLCTDQMLLLLAPQKIAGLSPLALDPTISFVAKEARYFPTVEAVRGSGAEAGPRPRAGRHLRRRRPRSPCWSSAACKVMRVPIPRNFDEIRTQLRALADLLEVPERGEELEDRMDALLDSVPHRVAPPVALMWGAGGWSSGPDTLGGAVLTARPTCATPRPAGGSSLETVATHPPDLLVINDPPSFPSLATDLLDHPALARHPADRHSAGAADLRWPIRRWPCRCCPGDMA